MTSLRVTLFVSGCTRHCKNCFNAETWDFNYGKPFTKETEDEVLAALAPSFINGLTLLGGEPMEPQNQRALVPFLHRVRKLFNQGMIQAYAYTDDRGQYVPAAEVVEGPADANGEPTFTWNGEHANREFGKMGKSLKNIITPDDMYANYGADTFRLYEMGMGPLAESRPWNTRNVVGSMRFLQRLWRNVVDENTGEVRVTDGKLDTKTLKLLNNTIADVTVEMEAMRPNTAIAKLIVLNNHLTSLNEVPRAAVEPLILMLSPIAPHICEELWNKLGHGESLAHAEWPKADERYVGQDAVTAVVQIKGKVRAKLEVSPDIDPKELEKMALEAVADRLGGKEPRKVIVKAPKIVSIVPAE